MKIIIITILSKKLLDKIIENNTNVLTGLYLTKQPVEILILSIVFVYIQINLLATILSFVNPNKMISNFVQAFSK